MEFKKCPRCGSFFNSDLEVCQKCKANENLDIQKLENYFEKYGNEKKITMHDISVQTGISSRNLNRYMLNEKYSSYFNNQEKSSKETV